MDEHPYIFLLPEETKHIEQWFDKNNIDRSSCDTFLSGRKFETVNADACFSEKSEDYAHIDEEKVLKVLTQLIKDFDKHCREIIMFPAQDETWYESESIDEPAVVPLSSLGEFLFQECLLFQKDYFITSKDFNWWICLCKDEKICTWCKNWC